MKPERKLILLDFTEEEKASLGMQSPASQNAVSSDREIASKVPTDKEELFAYKLDWGLIEKFNILKESIEPWVSKKLEEYLGENEESLCKFIMTKLTSQCKPKELLGNKSYHVNS